MAILDPSAQLPFQDYVLIGGIQTPGVATVTGASSIRNWNTPAVWGASCNSSTFIGSPAADFEIRLTLWKGTHFAQLELLKRGPLALTPPPGTAPKPIPGLIGFSGPTAFDIQHPYLQGLVRPITKAILLSMSQPEADDQMVYTVVLKLREWGKPIAAISKPDDAIPGVPTPTPTALTASEQVLKDKVSEFNSVRAK